MWFDELSDHIYDFYTCKQWKEGLRDRNIVENWRQGHQVTTTQNTLPTTN